MEISKNNKIYLILIILFVSTFAFRIYFSFKSTEEADVTMFHEVSQVTLSGKNPYLLIKDIYVYPPLSVIFQTSILFISENINVPYHTLIKLFSNLFDLFIAFLIFNKIKNTGKIKALTWSLVFFLNPVSIIISSIHGQIDSISIFFLMISLFILDSKKKSNRLLSALFYGLSVSIKPIMFFLLPYFLMRLKKHITNIGICLLFIALPILIPSFIFLSENPIAFFAKIINYSGVYDIGYLAIVRGFYFYHNASFWLPNSLLFLAISKYLFLFLIIVCSFGLSKKLDPFNFAFLSIILFYLIHSGLSVQYLSWTIPIAILKKDKLVFWHIILSTTAIVFFYLFFAPNILFGGFVDLVAYKSIFMFPYLLANLLLYSFFIFWFVDFSKRELIFRKLKIHSRELLKEGQKLLH